MKSASRGTDARRRPVRTGAAAVAAAVIAVLALAAAPASAQIEVPALLPLPSSSPLLNSVTDVVEDTTSGLLGEVPEPLGGLIDGLQEEVTPEPGTQRRAPRTRSWSTTRRLEGDEPGAASASLPAATLVSSASHRPASYGAAVSEGFSRAFGRAANLAGPLAAPFAVAFVAVGLLTLAARGPGRLVKVEEERQKFREHRTYRL